MTDIELALAAMRGDADAFAQLHRTYDRLVRNIAGRITRDAGLVDEVASEVWFGLATGHWRITKDATPADGQLHGFVALVARQAALRLAYRPGYIAARTVENYDDEGSLLMQLRARDPDPERRLLQRELRARIYSVLDGLPPQYRRVAIARYIHELSGPDIARLVGVQPTTIPSYLANIRAKFRAALRDLVAIDGPGTRQCRGGYRRFRRLHSRDDSPSPRTSQADDSPSPAGPF